MSQLQPCWTIMSYEIQEPDGRWERYYWYSATMEKDHMEPLLRTAGAGVKVNLQNLQQHDENHWSCTQSPNRFGNETKIEVYFPQEEMPRREVENRTTVYNHRERDLKWERERQSSHDSGPVRPGFKKLPMTFSFGKK